MKKKLLFVIPALRNGGAERVASIVLNAAVKRSYEVTLMLVLADDIGYDLNPSIRVVSVQKKLHKSKIIPRAVSIIGTMRSIIKEVKPDIIVSFMTTMNMYTVLATLGLHATIVGSERNAPGMERNSWVRSLLTHVCYHLIDGMIFQTEEAKAYFTSCRMKSSVVIPNPVKKGLPRWAFEHARKKCVAVGRLEQQKNYPLLLNAFQLFHGTHSDYSLEIYGDGSFRKKLEEQVRELDLEEHVFFKGVCSDVHAQIKDAAMFVMSSDFEGIPNALLESLAMGIPSVATDCPCGGVRMLMKNGQNGYLVQVNDTKALASRMCDIVEYPRNAREMSQRAVEDMNQYTEEAICKQYFSYFDSRMSARKKK